MTRVHSVDKVVSLPISKIRPSPWKIRKTRLNSLEQSIREDGLLEPIEVREIHNGRYQYQVTFGDGRLKAAQALGMETIPAVVRQCTEEEALRRHGIENLCRNNWSELEQGEYYSRFKQISGKSLREMELLFGVSKSQIGARIDFDLKLTPQAKMAVARRKISPSAVEYALQKLPQEQALNVIEDAVQRGLDFDGVISQVNAVKPTADIHEKAKQFQQKTIPNSESKLRVEDVTFTIEVPRSIVVRGADGSLLVGDAENHRDRDLVKELQNAWLKVQPGDLVELCFRHTTAVPTVPTVSRQGS
jgi:ParB family chromosome partitioning protein